MRWVATESHRLHDPAVEVWAGTPQGSTEVPARAEEIARCLAEDDAFEAAVPGDHGLAPVLAVHEAGLVRWLEEAWRECGPGSPSREIFPDTVLHPGLRAGMGRGREPAAAPFARLGYWCFDTMTPVVEGTYPAARSAVDCALTAADLVLAGDRAAYALCRPPGHHAARSVLGGFCYLNNAAIAARHLCDSSGGPVAILDLDYHHGNGTQQIFYEHGEVLYASLHADPDRAFPYFTGHRDETGTGRGAGSTLNIPLPPRCGDRDYLAELDGALDVIGGYGAAVLVVSLGMDTYEHDPICDLAITADGFYQMGKAVSGLGLPSVIIQEGGYHVAQLGHNVRRWLRGFLGIAPSVPGAPAVPAVPAASPARAPGERRL
jgi:acetoin utilization deacetylase AcuC-like enzyme